MMLLIGPSLEFWNVANINCPRCHGEGWFWTKPTIDADKITMELRTCDCAELAGAEGQGGKK